MSLRKFEVVSAVFPWCWSCLLTTDNLTKNSAIRYSARRNWNRRNITRGDKFRLMRVLDERGEHGGDQSLNFSNASAKITAKLIGVSEVQVQKMRTILDYGTDEDIEAVEW